MYIYNNQNTNNNNNNNPPTLGAKACPVKVLKLMVSKCDFQFKLFKIHLAESQSPINLVMSFCCNHLSNSCCFLSCVRFVCYCLKSYALASTFASFVCFFGGGVYLSNRNCNGVHIVHGQVYANSRVTLYFSKFISLYS